MGEFHVHHTDFGGVRMVTKTYTGFMFKFQPWDEPPIFINFLWLTSNEDDNVVANQHVIFAPSSGKKCSINKTLF